MSLKNYVYLHIQKLNYWPNKSNIFSENQELDLTKHKADNNQLKQQLEKERTKKVRHSLNHFGFFFTATRCLRNTFLFVYLLLLTKNVDGAK